MRVVYDCTSRHASFDKTYGSLNFESSRDLSTSDSVKVAFFFFSFNKNCETTQVPGRTQVWVSNPSNPITEWNKLFAVFSQPSSKGTFSIPFVSVIVSKLVAVVEVYLGIVITGVFVIVHQILVALFRPFILILFFLDRLFLFILA